MSVPTDFLTKFCQTPPAPKPISEQDIIDDFVNAITKCASESTSNDVYVRYELPEKFTNIFTKQQLWRIIMNVVMKQMGFSEARFTVTFNHDQWSLPYKTYYYEKKVKSYQYNEEYIHHEHCKFSENPDSIFLKMYVPK